MAAHQEIELKRLLVGPGAAERLLRVLGPVASDVEQINHVFDTSDRRLHQARHALRLRQEGERFSLTAKGPSQGVSGSVSARTEAEAEIAAELARRILGGQGDVLAELRRRVTDPAFDALWTSIERARGGQPLEEVGHFHNQRRTVEVSVSPELSLAVEVDTTRFPNDRVEDEVEIELPRADLCGVAEAWLEERAAAAGVETRPSSAKLARFYAALAASPAGGSPR